MTKQQIAMNFGQPFPFGGGFVYDERRGNASFRSQIFPTRQAAQTARNERIAADWQDVKDAVNFLAGRE